MLHPRCLWGPKSAPGLPLNRAQREGTQVTQKTLRKKATCEKHMVSLYFSRDIHPISPTFIKLLFETVNGSCVHDIKRKAVLVT